MAERLSGRALAAAFGVDEKAVRNAVSDARIKRGSDGRFDLDEARADWLRSTEPSRTKVRKSALAQGPQSAAPADVRTLLPQADLDALWAIVAELPVLAAWGAALGGGGLNLAFDLAADMELDITGNLHLRGFAKPPIAFEPVDWPGLAKEIGHDLIDPATMRADWQRRRDEG